MANLTDIGYGPGKYLTVSDASGVPGIGANRKNLDSLNFRLATNNAYALYNFKDGMIDAYNSEAGIDTAASTNETYDATNDLYSPTGGNSNMTLVSRLQTAQSAPDEGRLLLYEEDVDSITLDTDLIGYVSRDNGTTYTQTPLALDTNLTHPTSLLLHCDGANDGVLFPDSSFWTNNATVAGDTHTDTAVKKIGTASAQFVSTGDYIDYGSGAAFGFGTGDWTVDFWIYGAAGGFGAYGYPFDFRPAGAAGNHPALFLDTGNGNIPGYFDGSSGTDCSSNVSMSVETWYHIAVVKYNNVTKVYTNGVTGASGTYPVSYADTIDYGTANGIRLGKTTVSGDVNQLNGYIDEFRVTKGVARWTANFTPSTSAYSGTEGNQRLLSGSVDISGQPSGTDMKYKVTTHNTKDLKLHGASMLWA